jgi:hypothetical protein
MEQSPKGLSQEAAADVTVSIISNKVIPQINCTNTKTHHWIQL